MVNIRRCFNVLTTLLTVLVSSEKQRLQNRGNCRRLLHERASLNMGALGFEPQTSRNTKLNKKQRLQPRRFFRDFISFYICSFAHCECIYLKPRHNGVTRYIAMCGTLSLFRGTWA